MRKGSKHTKETLMKISLHSARKGKIGTFFGHKHTKESRMKMSKIRLENPNRYWLGKKFSEETKRKLRLHNARKGKPGTFLGKKHTEESKKKMRITKKRLSSEGKLTAWNKGRKGYHLSEEHKRKIRENHPHLSGCNHPMYGKHHSIESRRKISNANKGKIVSKETRIKVSNANKGRISINKGKKRSEKIKIKISNTLKKDWSKYSKEKKDIRLKNLKEARKHQIIPIKDTTTEVKIQNFLKEMGIEYFTHQYIKEIKHTYQCDIFIPEQGGIFQKTIIECDGDFFHMNPNKFSPEDKCFENGITAKERWKLDNNRTQELIEKGFRVIRLWENEIRVMEINDFREKIYAV